MTTDVALAEQTIRDLAAKREASLGQATALGEERQRISYSAHAGGNAAARQRLNVINKDSTTAALELESIDAAIAEANARLAAAKCNEARQADRAKASALQEHVAALRKHGEQLDATLSAFVAAHNGFLGTLRGIHRLGIDYPTAAIASNATKIALRSGTMGTGLQIEHIAPASRRTFESLTTGWVGRLEGTIAEILGEKAEAA
jgi:hypothetical protein